MSPFWRRDVQHRVTPAGDLPVRKLWDHPLPCSLGCWHDSVPYDCRAEGLCSCRRSAEGRWQLLEATSFLSSWHLPSICRASLAGLLSCLLLPSLRACWDDPALSLHSRSLPWSLLQSPLCHIWSHIHRFRELGCGHLWWGALCCHHRWVQSDGLLQELRVQLEGVRWPRQERMRTPCAMCTASGSVGAWGWAKHPPSLPFLPVLRALLSLPEENPRHREFLTERLQSFNDTWPSASNAENPLVG